jgi:hypothetical protein
VQNALGGIPYHCGVNLNHVVFIGADDIWIASYPVTDSGAFTSNTLVHNMDHSADNSTISANKVLLRHDMPEAEIDRCRS